MHIQVLLEIVGTSRIEHSIVIIKVENIEFEEKIRLSKKKHILNLHLESTKCKT